MRAFTLTLICTGAALALAAGAAAASEPQQQDQSASEIRITGHPLEARLRLDPYRMKDVQGAYPMSEGQWLNIALANRKLYAELNDRGQTELVQIDKDTFAARDQPMTLRFYQGTYADQIEIAYVPDGALAPVAVSMAMNR